MATFLENCRILGRYPTVDGRFLCSHGVLMQREAAKAFLRNMKGEFKAKVADPSRAAFTRSRTLFPSKRMRMSSPGAASPVEPAKVLGPPTDLASPTWRMLMNDENTPEGRIAILPSRSLEPGCTGTWLTAPALLGLGRHRILFVARCLWSASPCLGHTLLLFPCKA